MLQVERLSYAYPHTEQAALQGISFTLEPGNILLVAGGTGSGKSTLCYALAGFVPHFFQGEIEGDVTLEGRSMRDAALGSWVQQVGLVLQNPFNQISGARMTVFEEVAFGLENLGVPREELGKRVTAVLEELEIAELAERSPYALSGGQMQRVAIASILALNPRLLVLDEPTAQLDPAGTADVFGVLRTLAERGSTVVVATHQLEDAAPLATRALVLHKGKIVTEGTTREVLGDPRLAEWDVEPPIYVPLAARLGKAPPLPITLDQARDSLSSGELSPRTESAGGWPFSPAQVAYALPVPPPVSSIPVAVEALRFSYPNGVEALRGITLDLSPGRITALIGSNGAGKSTLSRTINGLLRPASGSIRIGEWLTADHAVHELARRVGYLFQNPDEQLFKSTVAAEVAFGPEALGFSRQETEEAVQLALGLTGLTGHEETHPYDLHPTMRRWVALASVLAVRAPVLILDEPTTGLDLDGKQTMVALIDTLKEAGYTLLVISHDMQFVAETADYVYVMAQGQVVTYGTPAEAFATESHLETAHVEPPPVARLARSLGLGQGIVTATALEQALVARAGNGLV